LLVRADSEKARQILLNLLSNAVKFTERGLVRVEVSTAGAEHVAVRVRDTGVGIPAERIEEVFSPFVQIGRGLASTHEGTGLGLAISRDLARGMGGDLTAESEVGVGSTFTLRLRRG
jgi:signal transduction histidine kinase